MSNQAGMRTTHVRSPEVFRQSVARAEHGDAQLCLKLEKHGGRLSLQITHGPCQEPQAEWLELFGCSYAVDTVDYREADAFLDSLRYGIELMTPRNPRRFA